MSKPRKPKKAGTSPPKKSVTLARAAAPRRRIRAWAGVAVAATAVATVAAAVAWRPGAPVALTVPEGASLSEVADTLSARGIIRAPR